MNALFIGIIAFFAINVAYGSEDIPVKYFGHKVITVTPKTEEELLMIKKLRDDYKVDLWNEPRWVNGSVMMRLEPKLVGPVMRTLRLKNVKHFVAFHDLQSVIDRERAMNAPIKGAQNATAAFDFGKYNTYDELVRLLKSLASTYPSLAKLETIGLSYENRGIQLIRITSGQSGVKPAIMMECGIHAREWSSVSTCAYMINKLITEYSTDAVIKALVDKYEFYIVPEANPDGYVYTWTHERLWRKTRSHSSIDWLGVCRGTDANRNFDVNHCGVGTSRKPCDEIFCGDKPFSESEARALRDLMVKIGNRMKAYFSIHAYSQLWMTPYGITKKLPPNYNELVKIATAGTEALRKPYGTVYRVGSIANIIYEASGSSADYAYVKQNIPIAYALELRDTGRHGFFLPQNLILPTAIETFAGLQAAILAL